MIADLRLKLISFAEFLLLKLKTANYGFSKKQLPPGELTNLHSRERRNQKYLLGQFEKHGPIFKSRNGRELYLCVTGLKRCRTLIAETNIRTLLSEFATQMEETIPDPASYADLLDRITKTVLFNVFYGVDFGTVSYKTLLLFYKQMLYKDQPWILGSDQKKVFFELREFLLNWVQENHENAGPVFANSILGKMHLAGVMDDNSLGNLIIMIQVGGRI